MNPSDVMVHSVHCGITPLKETTPSFLPSLPLNWQTVQAPLLFRQSPPPLYWFFVNLPQKVGFFSEPQKYSSFSSSIPSYLLKVTNILGKISQFEFLVITKKNIFAYKLFCH